MVFLLYFLAVNGGYLMLNVLSFINMRRHIETQILDELPKAYNSFSRRSVYWSLPTMKHPRSRLQCDQCCN